MPINEPLLEISFFILFGMVFVWFVLVKLLCMRLQTAHPAEYERMGRPSLFWRNSPAGVIAMLKFLLTREHKYLNDGYLSRLSDAMLAFFLIYTVLFLALFFSIMGRVASRAT